MAELEKNLKEDDWLIKEEVEEPEGDHKLIMPKEETSQVVVLPEPHVGKVHKDQQV